MDILRKLGVPLPDAASTYAPAIDRSLNIIHLGMFIIFIVAALFFIYALIKFRQGAHPQADSNTHKWAIRSFLPDASILIFEIWLIFVFGFPIWSQVKDEFPEEKSSLVVDLVGEQFAWNFQYPGADGTFGKRDPKLMGPSNPLGLDPVDPNGKDDIALVNQLYAILNKPTVVYMTSKDVIHSFFVPEFRVKQDMVPGMRIPLWFEATKTGEFELVCSQLCGLGHYRMKGTVVVLSSEDFEKKMAELIKEAAEQRT